MVVSPSPYAHTGFQGETRAERRRPAKVEARRLKEKSEGEIQDDVDKMEKGGTSPDIREEAWKTLSEEFETDFSRMDMKIHRFPSGMKNLGERYIVPMVVAIGPYHRDLEKRQEMEKVKHVAAYQFVSSSTGSLKKIQAAILSVAGLARSLYHDSVVAGVGDDDFAGMMLLDGCFLLQYMLMFTAREKLSSSLLCCFDSNQVCISNDIMLMENQIPWVVIETLRKFKEVPVEEFVAKMGRTLQARKEKKKEEFFLGDEYKPPHLLGLLRFYKTGHTLLQVPKKKEEKPPVLTRSSAGAVPKKKEENPLVLRSSGASGDPKKKEEKTLVLGSSSSASEIPKEKEEKPILLRSSNASGVPKEKEEKSPVFRSGSVSGVLKEKEEEPPVFGSSSASEAPKAKEEKPPVLISGSASEVHKEKQEKPPLWRSSSASGIPKEKEPPMLTSGIVSEVPKEKEEKTLVLKSGSASEVDKEMEEKPPVLRSSIASGIPKEKEPPLLRSSSGIEVLKEKDEKPPVLRSSIASEVIKEKEPSVLAKENEPPVLRSRSVSEILKENEPQFGQQDRRIPKFGDWDESLPRLGQLDKHIPSFGDWGVNLPRIRPRVERRPKFEDGDESPPMLRRSNKANEVPASDQDGEVSMSKSICAIELAEIGIELIASKTTKLVDMGMEKTLLFGNIFLAPLLLDDIRSCWLVNMAAFEVCLATGVRDDEEPVVCSYLAVLAMLMDREKDVHELRSKRLVQGELTNGETLQFFKTLIKHIRGGSLYIHILEEIEDYKLKRWIMIKIYEFMYKNKKTIVAVLSVIGVLAGIFKVLLSLNKN